jgi:hypothetical protein
MTVGNRGNPRSGSAAKQRLRGRRYKQRPWRDDIVIRNRMMVVQRCWYSGLTLQQSLDNVNAARPHGEPMITSLSTIVTDRHNLQVLAAEQGSRPRSIYGLAPHLPENW